MCRHEYADTTENTRAQQKAGKDVVAVQPGIHSSNDQENKRGKTEQHAKQSVQLITRLSLARDCAIVLKRLFRHAKHAIGATGYYKVIFGHVTGMGEWAGKDFRFCDADHAQYDFFTLSMRKIGKYRDEFALDRAFDRVRLPVFRRLGCSASFRR